jgi:hypothetical protein
MTLQLVGSFSRSLCYFVCAVFFLVGAIKTQIDSTNHVSPVLYIISAMAFVLGSIIDLIMDSSRLWTHWSGNT